MKNIKYNYNLQITIDAEEIEKKYPNYRFNFKNTDEFVQFIINDIQQISKVGLDDFGYSIKVFPKQS